MHEPASTMLSYPISFEESPPPHNDFLAYSNEIGYTVYHKCFHDLMFKSVPIEVCDGEVHRDFWNVEAPSPVVLSWHCIVIVDDEMGPQVQHGGSCLRTARER